MKINEEDWIINDKINEIKKDEKEIQISGNIIKKSENEGGENIISIKIKKRMIIQIKIRIMIKEMIWIEIKRNENIITHDKKAKGDNKEKK